jgi:hypothetical protein
VSRERAVAVTAAIRGTARPRAVDGGQAQHTRPRASGQIPHDVFALVPGLNQHHRIGIDLGDLALFHRRRESPRHEAGSVHDHTIEVGARARGHTSRRLGGLPGPPPRRGHTHELEAEQLGVTRSRERPSNTPESHGGRGADLRLTDVGVDDRDGQPAGVEGVREPGREGGLARLGGAEDEDDARLDELVERALPLRRNAGGERRAGRNAQPSVLMAARMRVSPSLISVAFVA